MTAETTVDLMAFVPKVTFELIPIKNLVANQDYQRNHITGISYFPLKGQAGTIMGYAWYGQSSFQGTIIGNDIKGLRIRVGNILIGEHTSLNHVFKDPRFNGWVIGEVYIRDPDLIPNARRDDFEHNDAYYILIEQLRTLASEIVRKIRSASTERNKPLSKAVEEVESITEKAEGRPETHDLPLRPGFARLFSERGIQLEVIARPAELHVVQAGRLVKLQKRAIRGRFGIVPVRGEDAEHAAGDPHRSEVCFISNNPWHYGCINSSNQNRCNDLLAIWFHSHF